MAEMPRSPLQPFFEPESVAVIGASRTAGKPGYHQIVNLQRSYSGSIYPINPNAETICGLPCYATLEQVPGPIDLAIVLLPAAKVSEAVSSCVALRIPGVMIPSSGFAEAGPEGESLQDSLLGLARGSDTRIWGPNCGGLVNTANGLTAAFIDLPFLRRGPVGIVSQTGLYVAALMNQMMEIEDFGVSKVATLGNASDVNEIDVLDYLAADPETQVIALHLESVTEGDRLAARCREITRQKPIVAVMAGRTEAGAKAGASHTARLAADARIVNGAFSQSGIVTAREFTDLIALTRAFALWQSAAPARNVAVLSTSGGGCVLAADQISQAGLKVAEFSPQTLSLISTWHPYTYGVANPYDIWPAMERHGTNRAVEAVGKAVFEDEAVDAALLIFGAFSSGGSDLDPAVFGDLAARGGKPAVAWLYGPADFLDPWSRRFAEHQIPCFHDLKSAVAALQASDFLADHRAQAVARPADQRQQALAKSREIIGAARARGANSLSPSEANRLLEAWGIRSAREVLAANETDAIEAATEVGYPVAAKIVSPDVAHKLDVGGVALNIASDDELRLALRRMTDAVGQALPKARMEGFQIQAMVPEGCEIIVGASETPQFGMVVMCGLGGSLVEALGEAVFRIPPLGPCDLDDMIDESRAGVLMRAQRGQPAADREALRSALQSLSDLAASGLGIEQMEVNPLLVLEEGRGAIAVDALIVIAGESGDAGASESAPG